MNAWNRARENIKLLMTPGPVEVSPRVLSAMAQPVIYHYYRGFVDFFEETTRKMAQVFQAKNLDTLILQGEGVLGLEASVACTVNRGEKVLVFENGPFGKWFGEFVKNAGATPIYFHEENNRCFDTQEAINFLEEHKDAAAMTMVHCETPAGLLNPPRELCRKAKSLGILTIVDCVASLGGVDFLPEEWEIDLAVGASQKCLSSTAGLTPMIVSKFAWEKMEQKKEPIRQSYLSLLDWRETWVKAKTFPFTPFTGEIYGLSAALDEILEEGLQNVFARHDRVASYVRKRAVEIGLDLWPEEENFSSPTLTAISIPERMDDTKIIQDIANRYGILIGGGYRELKGKVLRVGHMGYQAHMPFVTATMDAFESVIKSS